MKLKSVFPNNYRKMLAQFKDMPAECKPLFDTAIKRDALTMIKEFHNGIKADTLGLKKLKEQTVERKRMSGFLAPEVPLYARGDGSKKNSYMNSLRIRAGKNSYIVHPSDEKHWTGKIELSRLVDIHEHGVVISPKGKAHILRGSKSKGELIRIPPRPAMHLAFKKAMKKRDMKGTAKLIKATVVAYLMDGNKKYIVNATKYMMRGLKKYELAG